MSRYDDKTEFLTRRFPEGESCDLQTGEPIRQHYNRWEAVENMDDEGGGIFDLLGRLVCFVAPRPKKASEL